jgi:hypothetical protein
MQRKSNSNCNTWTNHGRGKTANGIAEDIFTLFDGDDGFVEKGDAHLAKGVENGAYQQGTEKTLSHGAQRVNAVSLEGKDNVFAAEKCLEFVHGFSLSFSRLNIHPEKACVSRR